jgi:hypothetical protein
MTRYERIRKFDNAILEAFQIGQKPGDIFREINRAQIAMKQKLLISRDTIERMYRRWIDEGCPGKLTFTKAERLEDGRIVLTYQDKKKQLYIMQGKEV